MMQLELFSPDCSTTPRFMEALDFLQVEDSDGMKICICGKTFWTNFGDHDTCYQCEKEIDAQKEILDEVDEN